MTPQSISYETPENYSNVKKIQAVLNLNMIQYTWEMDLKLMNIHLGLQVIEGSVSLQLSN